MHLYLHLPLLLLLHILAFASPSFAGHSLPRRALDHAHRVALRRSAGLARDLRVALKGVLVAQPASGSGGVYCVVGSTPTSGNATTPPATKASPTSSVVPSATPTSDFNLIESHQGSNFFSGWDFFTAADPTHGTVQFVDQATGQSAGLVEINSAGNAVMRVETTPTVQNTRQSIRITTQSNVSNGALVIMDSVHVPTGCGVWPAWWMNGPNWPAGGEVDIIEGVNNYTNNQATIHTNPGCSIPSSSSSTLAITGTVVGGTDCAAADSNNEGCGVRAAQNNTFGTGFNAQGGGVYAMQWDSSGIAIYFFARGSIPADITANAPQPSSWGTPMARWPATSCNPFEYFYQMTSIFDTTLCGDWAGSVWTGTGIPGQAESCAQITGFSTCEAFVLASGASFQEAYWEVSSVKIYKQK